MTVALCGRQQYKQSVGSRSFDRLPTLYDSFSHRWKSSEVMVPRRISFLRFGLFAPSVRILVGYAPGLEPWKFLDAIEPYISDAVIHVYLKELRVS